MVVSRVGCFKKELVLAFVRFGGNFYDRLGQYRKWFREAKMRLGIWAILLGFAWVGYVLVRAIGLGEATRAFIT